jgi:hypothetical protein
MQFNSYLILSYALCLHVTAASSLDLSPDKCKQTAATALQEAQQGLFPCNCFIVINFFFAMAGQVSAGQ